MNTGTSAEASIVVPVKGMTSGKSRLSEALSPAERAALNRRLADHVLTTATDCVRTNDIAVDVYLLSPDLTTADIAVSHAAHFLHQTTQGLNTGLSEAATHLPARRTVILAADLPIVTAEDIALLLQTNGIGIAPDLGRTGTNAMSLPEPGTLPFYFGPGSLQRHLEAARERELPVQIIQQPGLATDLDTKEDLQRIEGWP